ncbi:hypothetical protein SAMN05216378_4635 [Paenibacillus catalpae]|uniref:Uncharacterized protein n=1 Tax=Paenibacillus catalpae TaxID=1045775 RepID=A0A1I2F3K5_9BACL|nr:hypothetical protein SAMN05216378_4635 [Paenibacillus catalpae]
MKPTVLTPPPYTPDMLIPPCSCIPLEGWCHSSTFALCSVYSIVCGFTRFEWTLITVHSELGIHPGEESLMEAAISRIPDIRLLH